METGIELSISCSDTMINYQFSQKLKLLGNSEFNHLIIILTSNNKILLEKRRDLIKGEELITKLVRRFHCLLMNLINKRQR